jgi:uncharacterized protein
MRSPTKRPRRGLHLLPCVDNVYTLSREDVTFELQGQLFEWDAEKAAGNIRKHHVSFEKACEVFFDPFLRLVDTRERHEAREAAIGLALDWSLLFVVHVVRRGDTIRIISCRPATPAEKRGYEGE